MADLTNDIQKYIKGKLSPAQMHALEMRALHDPFLADALEGAESIDPKFFDKDLDDLSRRVQKKRSIKYVWTLGIAASILLVLTVTYLTFFNNVADTNEQIALSIDPKESIEQPSNDLQPNENKNSEAKIENIIAKESVTGVLTPEPIKEKVKSSGQVLSSETLSDKNESANVSSMPLSEAKESDFIAEAEESEIPIQTVMLDDESDDIVANEKMEVQRARAQVAKKSAPSLSSGAGAEYRKTDLSETSKDKTVSNETDYQRYLETNVRYPIDAIANSIEGEVTISFILNSDGTPTDFSIVNGIGFGCDEELIRLIKEGPAWTPTDGENKTEVKFQFKLPEK